MTDSLNSWSCRSRTLPAKLTSHCYKPCFQSPVTSPVIRKLLTQNHAAAVTAMIYAMIADTYVFPFFCLIHFLLSNSLSASSEQNVSFNWTWAAKPSKVLVIQSCLTLCDSMHCCPPGSSSHGISQARILQWVASPFSRGSSQLRDWIWVPCISDKPSKVKGSFSFLVSIGHEREAGMDLE